LQDGVKAILNDMKVLSLFVYMSVYIEIQQVVLKMSKEGGFVG